jgi:hypothetical protein
VVEPVWQVVLALIERPEDGVALMALFERARGRLLANGVPIAALLEVEVPSERAVAERIAARLHELDGDDWRYTSFYRPTRGGPDPSEDEQRAFVERCHRAGVSLTG